jgi:magnesium transporter
MEPGSMVSALVRDDGGAQARIPCVATPTRWFHAEVSTMSDVERVCAETGAPIGLARHALDSDELARIDHDASGAVLVVLRAPVGKLGDREQLRTTALSVLLMPGAVMTLAAPGLAIDVHSAASHRAPVGILAGLVLMVAESFLEHLRAIEVVVNDLEAELQASLRNAELRGLLEQQKSLVHFRTAIASNMILLDRLLKDPHLQGDEAEREILDDAIVEMRQAAEMTNVASNILGEMMDAFASIISNNLNVVMKVMTAVMIMIAVPSLMAALYGMNVPLPGQNMPQMFGAILVVNALVVGALIVVFRRMRWF